MNRFYLKSFGCKVNQYDSQSLRDRLTLAGLQESPNPEGADLLVVSFCVVTGKSASRCLRALKSLRVRNPDADLLVAGCLSPGDRERARASCTGVLFLSENEGPSFLRESDPWQRVGGLQGHTRAFVKIQDGCNLSCSYCVIPSIRGGERSRPLKEVLEEADRLLGAGYRELVLCGIRLGGYRYEGMGLQHLLEGLLASITVPVRIRLSSLNPAEITPGLLEIIARDDRLAPHLHLPLQSGDKAILKAMRRPYSPKGFLERAAAIRRALPDPAITTDLIVGFPGEDEAAFEASLRLIDEARIARVHVFPYSSRQGTVSAGLAPVREGVKKERVLRALEAARDLKERYDRSFLGKTETVLVEKENGSLEGLTSRYQKVSIPENPMRRGRNDFIALRLVSYRDGIFQGMIEEHDRWTIPLR